MATSVVGKFYQWRHEVARLWLLESGKANWFFNGSPVELAPAPDSFLVEKGVSDWMFNLNESANKKR